MKLIFLDFWKVEVVQDKIFQNGTVFWALRSFCNKGDDNRQVSFNFVSLFKFYWAKCFQKFFDKKFRMKDVSCLFVRVINDKDNKVENWVDEDVKILFRLFFTKDAKIFNEIFEKLLWEKFLL